MSHFLTIADDKCSFLLRLSMREHLLTNREQVSEQLLTTNHELPNVRVSTLSPQLVPQMSKNHKNSQWDSRRNVSCTPKLSLVTAHENEK